MTFTMNAEQIERMEALRLTTIAGNEQSVPKTQEQQIAQILEYGLRALEQQRKQYLRQRAALQAYKGR